MTKARIKKLLSYYKPYRRLFAVLMVCAFLCAATALMFPLGVRYITKNLLEGGTATAAGIYRMGAALLVLVIVQAAANYFVDYRGHAMGAMMERDMRFELFEHLERMPLRFFDGQRTGQLMSRITNDLLNLAELYHHGPEDYAIYTVRFVGAFLVLLGINVQLTLIVFAFLPVAVGFSLILSRQMNSAFRRNLERIGDVNAQVEDSLAGIRVVKSFANEPVELEKFQRENDRFLVSRTDTYKKETTLWQGIILIGELILLSVVVFGGVAILNTRLDLADLITYLLYIGYLIEPVQRLSHMTQQFQEGITGFQRFAEIIEMQPEITEAQGAVELARVRGEIEFRDVAFRYQEDREYVFKDLSLKVHPGEYIALVGTSGVGKTTLCSLIPRFYEVSEGQVLMDGLDVRDVTLASLRRNVGVVQQDVYLFAGSVLENIRYGKPGASMEEIIAAARKANAHEFIMSLPNGYATDIGQRGVSLSGGQKQRLSIARVFLKDPPVLILDEATSSLDTESERVVQESLESLAQGRTAIVIAHRLSTIRNAKRILVLTENGIEEQGSHDELIALEGVYAKFHGLQFEVG